MDYKATYTKLRDGSWGVRIVAKGGLPSPNERVSVEKRNGETNEVVVGSMVWAGADRDSDGQVGIFRIKRRSQERRSAPSNGSYSGGGSRPGHVTGRSNGPLLGFHTNEHCSCGNWSGVNSPCLYSYSEAKDEGEAQFITWRREGEARK